MVLRQLARGSIGLLRLKVSTAAVIPAIAAGTWPLTPDNARIKRGLSLGNAASAAIQRGKTKLLRGVNRAGSIRQRGWGVA